MNNLRIKTIILLVVIITTNRAFTQSFRQRVKKTVFSKQNSITYQVGILNYFYDTNPIFVNWSEIEHVSRPKHIGQIVLIRTRGVGYTRRFIDKSNINFIYSRFKGYFIENELMSDNSKFPLVTSRNWRYFGIEYNRLWFEKNKFELYYGGGLNYRKGFEHYKVLEFNAGGFGETVGEGTRVQNIGATLNLNMRYTFWKRFFFYSKIDIQGYFHEAQVVKDDFKELNDKWDTREFEPSSRINHTLTIGIGVDF